MTKPLLIYGATGYTGKLLSEQAKKVGVDFIVAGRDSAKVEALGKRLGVKTRTFPVDDAGALRNGMDGAACILHCAGPFSRTARQVLDACLERKVHYLDITGEFSVFELAESLSEKARAAGVMFMPGVGWDVVPSDCLAVHTARRVKNPHKLRLALKHFGGVSRGSAMSFGEIVGVGPKARRDGVVVADASQQPAMFDFGNGPENCVPIPMGDIITAWTSTKIPNIEEYFYADPNQPAGMPDPATMPEGPTLAERAAGRSKVVAEVTDRDGTVVRSMIDTASGYTYTQEAGIEIARRVLAGDFKTGFQSPASAYGPTLATSVGDGRITDL